MTSYSELQDDLVYYKSASNKNHRKIEALEAENKKLKEALFKIASGQCPDPKWTAKHAIL